MLALIGLVSLPVACQRETPREETARPNVLFVLVDALRADALSAYGSSTSRMPVLDRLADRGFLFRRAYSNAPKTVPSVASLFTSTPPWIHRIEAGPDQGKDAGLSYLSDRLVLATEVLDEHGYLTGMITTTGWITPEANYDQGVDEYIVTKRADDAVIEAAEDFIARHADETFFVYVHLLDLHDYYHSDRLFGAPTGEDEEISSQLRSLRGASPSEIYRRLRTDPEVFTPADAAFLRRAYDRDLAATDAMIGRLLAALEAAQIGHETLVVITADHGEQFMEHGRFVHGGHGLYDEVLRVPLLIAGPGTQPRVIDEPVGTIDVFPTLFDLLGVETPDVFAGRSLAAGAGAVPNVVVASSGSTWKVITGRWSYILSATDRREELYDLGADPEERHDLATQQPEVAREMRRLLVQEIRRGREHPYLSEIEAVERVEMSEDVERTLRSLGYLE
ncbi:MAG TPA: sulfatase [Thermoanaerobaculia bacterium]|nr:sulfatase [Thermoanaerobaculia bacterium]